jgi:hypothetical protein
MAALTGAELIDEVRALTGREDDTVLCTTTRINRWLNEAQEAVIDSCPGLPCRHIEDLSAWYCVSTSNTHNLSDLADGTYPPAHIETIWYRNGTSSFLMDFMPADEFDERYPDPSNYTATQPKSWTRKGQQVHVAPWPSSDWIAAAAGDETGTYRVVYTAYAQDFTPNDTDTSDLSQADKGLILYSVAEAWGAIGIEEKRILWKSKFREWLDEYYAKYSRMGAWDDNIVMD